MTRANHCPRCGARLPADAPEESLCPQCLLKLGLDISSGGGDDAQLPTTEAMADSAEGRPDRIGTYKILDTLGEGGMGVVYLAEQTEPVRRRVALKLIKLGMDTKQVIARFEAERQALALMNHPNVAKVFDAGATEQGRPYFVMEYVPGIPITEYCDLKCLPLPERLELFTQVCEAIQHAHQKGIIHRDIKPSNVLVSAEEGKPQLKVIDFGVAKATSQRLTERTLYTQQGILIGTPEYMSPEQAGTTALDVDTRTDIYSLGVLLYELLVGALPFDPRTLRQAAAVEMLRIIREEDPPKPTTKFGSLGDGASEVARHRHTDVRSLGKQLRGELEWITMRALEKDPARRFSSPSELAADIHRHLRDQPVMAGPPGLIYRWRKLVKRNKVRVATTGAIGLMLVIGLAATAFLHFRKQAETTEALRWTLEQVIATGKKPSELEPDWPRMREVLRDRNKRHPRGPLAILAHRAAARVLVDVPSFGLLSEPPLLTVQWGIIVSPLPLEIAPESFALSVVERSWDGGPWRHLATSSWKPREGQILGTRLDRVVPWESTLAGPHRLDLRSALTIYESAVILPLLEHNERPDAKQLSVYPHLVQEERSLGSFAISLFEEYPDGFPREVPLEESAEPLDTWFQVNRVHVVRVTLPEGSGPCLSFQWPGAREHDEVACLPVGGVPTERFIAGFEMQGLMDYDAKLPIAADVSLKPADGEEPLLSFEFAFPLGIPFISLGSSWNVPSFSPPIEHDIRAFRRLDSAGTQIPADIPDGRHSGYLEFVPSRSVALATAKFEKYLGTTISLPVEITVSTVDGTWLDSVPWGYGDQR